MSNTYNWIIESLDCIPSIDNQSNVVNVVHWRVNGTDGTHNATIYGSQELSYNPSNPFIEYASLTMPTIIGWIQSSMGSDRINEIQQNIDNQINNLANPTVINIGLPWITA